MLGDSQRSRLLVHEPADGRRPGRRVHSAGLAPDYRRLSDFTTIFLVVSIVLILSPHVPGLGTDAGMGAKNWIKLGIQVQAGEFAKITVILLDASIMARYGGRLDDPREYVKALGLMLMPFACIMTQPDLGTGLVYPVHQGGRLGGGRRASKYLLITLGLFIAAIVAVFVVDQVIHDATGEYKLLKQYQRNHLSCSSIPTSTHGGLQPQASPDRHRSRPVQQGPVPGNAARPGHPARGRPPTSSSACWPRNWGFQCNGAAGAVHGLVFDMLRIAGASGDLFSMLIVMGIFGMWLFQILKTSAWIAGSCPSRASAARFK